MALTSIPNAAADIREGRMIIIVDDEDREKERSRAAERPRRKWSISWRVMRAS
jgi:3,4-dihydroxy-2-butanone 4-phosphate synthase